MCCRVSIVTRKFVGIQLDRKIDGSPISPSSDINQWAGYISLRSYLIRVIYLSHSSEPRVVIQAQLSAITPAFVFVVIVFVKVVASSETFTTLRNFTFELLVAGVRFCVLASSQEVSCKIRGLVVYIPRERAGTLWTDREPIREVPLNEVLQPANLAYRTRSACLSQQG
jgi:hypothetical protein